jgi:hypothetical protein
MASIKPFRTQHHATAPYDFGVIRLVSNLGSPGPSYLAAATTLPPISFPPVTNTR